MIFVTAVICVLLFYIILGLDNLYDALNRIADELHNKNFYMRNKK